MSRDQSCLCRTALVRTRMPGGVGGRSRKASSYPDQMRMRKDLAPEERNPKARRLGRGKQKRLRSCSEKNVYARHTNNVLPPWRAEYEAEGLASGWFRPLWATLRR